MKKQLTRLFFAGFALLWGWIFINSILRWQHNGPAALAVGLGFAFFVFLAARFGGPLLDGLSKKRWRLVFGIAFGVYSIVVCVMAWLLAEVPIMDMEVVIKTLPNLMKYGRFGAWNDYYVVCNNNVGLALVLGGWYKLASVFGFAPGNDIAGVAPGIALNAIVILGSVALVCALARQTFASNRGVALSFLLCAGFAPFVLYSPFFYSDTLSMPFALLALLAWGRYRTATSLRAKVCLLAAMAAAVFVGYGIKGSVIVVLVALIIQLFLENGFKSAAAGALALLAFFAVLVGSYRIWQRQSFLNWDSEEALGLPLQLWFCYGSHDVGDYSKADFDAAMTVDTLVERKALINERIRANYAGYTPLQLAEFVTKKAAITWGDGLYNAEEFLQTPQRANWTHWFIIKGQPGYMPLVYYCQAYLYMLLLFVVAGAVAAAKKAVANTYTLAAVCLVGLVLFLSAWETKARYALHFTPLLLLVAAGGALAVSGLSFKKKSER